VSVHTEKKHTVQKEKDRALIAFVMGNIYEEAHAFLLSSCFLPPHPLSRQHVYAAVPRCTILLEEKDKERGRKRWTFLAVKAQRGGEANKTTAKKCELLLIQYSLESLES
jgi:hypothetical protein